MLPGESASCPAGLSTCRNVRTEGGAGARCQRNGIPRPSVEEVSKVIAQAIEDANMEDIEAIFG